MGEKGGKRGVKKGGDRGLRVGGIMEFGVEGKGIHSP
jgi:hypothetical protein